MTTSYCDAHPVPTRQISSSIDLSGPSTAYVGALAVSQGYGGRQSPAPNLPVFIVHQRFLLPGAVEALANIPFTPEFQRSFAEEASAALGYRSLSLEIASVWLSQYVRRCPFTGSSNLFANVDRLYSPPLLAPGSSSYLARPSLYICLTAPPSGARFSSPGYPGSTVRLHPGDAVLCQSLADEQLHTGDGTALFLRLYGALGAETGPPPYIPSVNFTKPLRSPLSIALPPSPALTSTAMSATSSASSPPPSITVSEQEAGPPRWLVQQEDLLRREEELLVQQIEVDRQQEELRQAVQRAKTAEEKAAAKKQADEIALLARVTEEVHQLLRPEIDAQSSKVVVLEAKVKLQQSIIEKEREKASRANVARAEEGVGRETAETEIRIAQKQLDLQGHRLEIQAAALAEATERADVAETARRAMEERWSKQQGHIESIQEELEEARRQVEVADKGIAALIEYNHRRRAPVSVPAPAPAPFPPPSAAAVSASPRPRRISPEVLPVQMPAPVSASPRPRRVSPEMGRPEQPKTPARPSTGSSKAPKEGRGRNKGKEGEHVAVKLQLVKVKLEPVDDSFTTRPLCTSTWHTNSNSNPPTNSRSSLPSSVTASPKPKSNPHPIPRSSSSLSATPVKARSVPSALKRTERWTPQKALGWLGEAELVGGHGSPGGKRRRF